MFHRGFPGEDAEADAFDARGGAGEVLVNEGAVESDGFEDLGSAVALEGGDAHLGEDLEEAFVDGFLVVSESGFKGHAVGEEAAAVEILEGFDGEVGVDGACSVADEEGEVHDFAGLAAFDDEGDLGAGSLANEVMVDGGEGEEAGDGGVVLVDAAVGEDEEGVTVLDGARGAAAEEFEGALELLFTAIGGKGRMEGGGEKVAPGDAAEFFEVVVGEDGLFEFEGVAVFGRLFEDVALRADVGSERHHQLFADGVDGGIGDLGEELFEVMEEGLGLVGEAGEGYRCPWLRWALRPWKPWRR